MTDTTGPNGDRDRPSDREAAKNPRRPAMGPPEGTASAGSTSRPVDMALLRELTHEFGYWPATTDEADIERHRRLNTAPDYGPQVEAWAERHRMMGHHPHSAPTKENPERWDCDCGGVNRILTGEQIRMKFAHLKHRPRSANPDLPGPSTPRADRLYGPLLPVSLSGQK